MGRLDLVYLNVKPLKTVHLIPTFRKLLAYVHYRKWIRNTVSGFLETVLTKGDRPGFSGTDFFMSETCFRILSSIRHFMTFHAKSRVIHSQLKWISK